MDLIKKSVAALTAAAIVGIVVGGLSRVLMRLATLAAGGEPGFSVSGTFFIVLIYAAAMLPGAVCAALTTRRWRWVAGAAGSAFLCLPAVGVASAELGDTVGWSGLQWVGVAVVTVAIFATIAAAPVVTVRLVDRMVDRMLGRRRNGQAAAMGDHGSDSRPIETVPA